MSSKGWDWQQLLLMPEAAAAALALAFLAVVAVAYRMQVKLVLKSLGRNKRRSILTGLAILMLVFVVTLVWSILWFLDQVTKEKSKDFLLARIELVQAAGGVVEPDFEIAKAQDGVGILGEDYG